LLFRRSQHPHSGAERVIPCDHAGLSFNLAAAAIALIGGNLAEIERLVTDYR